MKKVTFEEGTVYHGDCLEVMRHLPADSVDLVIGSPPYEAQRTYGIDFNLQGQDWVDWMVEIVESCLRVCTGLVALVIDSPTKQYSWSGTTALLMADLIRKGVCLRRPCIYQRQGILGSGQRDWLRNKYEWILCATRGGPLPWSDNTACGHEPKYGPGGAISHRNKSGKRRSAFRYTKQQYEQVKALMKAENISKTEAVRRLGWKMAVTPGAKRADGDGYITAPAYVPPEKVNPGNIIDCGAGGGGAFGSNIAHENEAPFPEKIPDFFIRSFCPPNGVVYDPFSGSGTTAACAVKLGRRFIASDIRLSQVKLTARRIKQARLRRGFGLINKPLQDKEE